MHLDQGSSWRQRGRPQPVDPAQDLGKQGSWDGDLRHRESYLAAVADHVRAGLDQHLAQRRQRPVLRLIRQGRRPHEIAQIVGNRMSLKTHRIARLPLDFFVGLPRAAWR